MPIVDAQVRTTTGSTLQWNSEKCRSVSEYGKLLGGRRIIHGFSYGTTVLLIRDLILSKQCVYSYFCVSNLKYRVFENEALLPSKLS